MSRRCSSTASTHEASWKMRLFQLFCVICWIPVSAAQDPEEVSITPHSNFTTPTVKSTTEYYESPSTTVHLMSSWLDVFPNEKVKFNCSIQGSSDWHITWYHDEEDLPKDSKFSLSGDGSILTITGVTSSHSGNYSCDGQHKTKGVPTEPGNALKLVVYDEIPKPAVIKNPDYDPMYIGETVSLTCRVGVASNWKYQWFKDGNKLSETSESITMTLQPDDKGSYSCQATRGETTTPKSHQSPIEVLAPPTPTLKQFSRWKDVFINEAAEFTCEVKDPTLGWTFTWYKNKLSLEDGSVSPQKLNASSIKIIIASKTYEGQYSCKAHLSTRGVESGFSNTAEIQLYDRKPKLTVNKVPDYKPMYVGEKVIFTCTVDLGSDWTYQWFRDEKILPDTNNVINIKLQLGDEGSYFCKATRGDAASSLTTTDFSDKQKLEVLDIPVPSLVNLTQWLDVFPTETVRFRCSIGSSSGWTYKWFRDGHEVQADDSVSFDSNGAMLSINSASSKHRGQYVCKGHLEDRRVISHNSSSLTLKVYDAKPDVMVSQNPNYKVMFPGEFVNFSCHIDVSSGWEYQWKKDGNVLVNSGVYSIKPIKTTDKGSYECQIKRGRNPPFIISTPPIELGIEEKPKAALIQQPSVENMFVGESVVFDCKVETSNGWRYLWHKDGVLFHDDSSHFKIDKADLSHTGKYKCEAVRAPTMFKTEVSDERHLIISEIPVPVLKPETQWLDVFPTESLKLSCKMPSSSDWTYTWFKDTNEIQPDATLSFDADRSFLTINAASASHHGKYTCSAKLKSRNVTSTSSSELTLKVYDKKPTVILQQTPDYSVMHSGDPVSFSCHINVSSGWEYMWFKGDHRVSASGINHTISSVQVSSSGSYSCQVKRGKNTVFMSDRSQTAELDVKERPKAELILLTGWSEVFSTDSLVLRCDVKDSEDNWNFTWYKADVPIDQSTSAKHIVTPQNDPDQSLYTCRGVRNGRPSYSKPSEHYRTKNLLLKRRILLSISGCIFFGIIAVFIGCIVLRITRKPADDDMKPEEENLFLTMAQQKGCEIPSPLVEYITDAALNAPPKEADVNGTVCSEATPLPITPQDDQAVSTEQNNDAAENNGGLTSFKQ